MIWRRWVKRPLSLCSRSFGKRLMNKSKHAMLPVSPRTSKKSDRIRDELAAMGVVLKNSKDGTTWEIAR